MDREEALSVMSESLGRLSLERRQSTISLTRYLPSLNAERHRFRFGDQSVPFLTALMRLVGLKQSGATEFSKRV